MGPTHGWGPAVMGENAGGGRMERNAVSALPAHLGTGEPAALVDIILCPQSLPSAAQSPSPSPTCPPRALHLHSETPPETPSNELGLNPTHTPSHRALPPNSGTPHSGGPLDVLPLPLCAGPKPRPCPQGLCQLCGS